MGSRRYRNRSWRKRGYPRSRRYYHRKRSSGVVRTAKKVYYSWPARTGRRFFRGVIRRGIHSGLAFAWYGSLGLARWMGKGWH